MIELIEAKHIRKEYNGLVAVKDLTLRLNKGDIYGFIGPNGAGKTTTIKIFATLLQPTSGEAYIAGYDVVKEPLKVRKYIGYMPDFFGVYEDLKVGEYLEFFAASYALPKQERKQILNDVLELTDLVEKKNSYVAELSRGMRQRLCLAKTLIHDPEVLLLDEPASGLDPRARIEMREILKELKKMGKTIFISSHILPELADFCDKVGVIERGELLASGSIEEIMHHITSDRVITIGVLDGLESAKKTLEDFSSISAFKVEGNVIKANFKGEDSELSEILRSLILNEVKVVSFTEEDTNLEDLFMKITRGEVA